MVHIPHKNISKPWKSQLKYKTLYRNRNITYPPSDPAPVVPYTTDDNTEPAYYYSELTPTKFRRMNTFTASHSVIMGTTQHVPATMILDSGAGVSGVGEQWKLTDIS